MVVRKLDLVPGMSESLKSAGLVELHMEERSRLRFHMVLSVRHDDLCAVGMHANLPLGIFLAEGNGAAFDHKLGPDGGVVSLEQCWGNGLVGERRSPASW